MSFISKTYTLFKQQTEDPLKLVQAVCNSNEFRMNSFLSAIDKKIRRLREDEKEHYLVETTEGSPPRTVAVAGDTVGQFVSIPALMNVLLTEKNEHIQKLEKELQALAESHNSLLQQLEEYKEHLKLHEIKEEPLVSLESSKEETTQPVLMEGEGEGIALTQAKTLSVDSKDVPKASSESAEEKIQSILIEKDAEIISLKHEVAALQEELHEKETLLKRTLKKLENMHESMVQSQEGTKQLPFSQEMALLIAEKNKLGNSVKVGKSENLLSPAVTKADETKDIAICKFSENQVTTVEGNDISSEDKRDDQKEKDAMLEALLESLRKQIYTKEQHSDDTSKSDTFIATDKNHQGLEEEKGVLEDAPNTLIQKRKLEKEKMYLEKLCSLLIQERLQRKHLIEPHPMKTPEMPGVIHKDSSKVFSHKDDDLTVCDRTIKPEGNETSVEGFLISLIIKDLEQALDYKERKGDAREEEDVHKLKAEQHLGQMETHIIPDGSTTLIELNEKEEEFKLIMAEEIIPEDSLRLMPPKDMQQKNCTIKSKAEKEENIVKQEQDIIKLNEANVHIVDRENSGDGKDTDPLLTLQRELETCKKERNALLKRLEDYELEPKYNLEIATAKSFNQIQETSPVLLRELQTLREERDVLQAHLRAQILKENNLLLEYDMLKNEYENLKITLHKITIERDDLELKLNEYPWKERELDRLRYHAKESEVLRIERDRMKIKLEELAGIEVAYIKLIEKTEQLEMKLKEADKLKFISHSEDAATDNQPAPVNRGSSQSDNAEDGDKPSLKHVQERGEGEVKIVCPKTCERASQVPDAVVVCKADSHFLTEKATQTAIETKKKLATTEQDNTKYEEQVKVLEEYLHKIAVLRGERHQVKSELNQLRDEINKQFSVVNDLKQLKHKLNETQQLKEKASNKVLQDVKLQLTEFKQQNLLLKDEVEKLRNAQLQLKSQLKMEEKLIKKARTLEDERRCLQKEFKQLQQDIAKESFRTNQRLKQGSNIEHLQLSDMCDELENFRIIFKQLLTENSAMENTIAALKETEMQLKNLTTQMDEENLSLGKKVVELQEENASLRDTLFEGQQSLKIKVYECNKDISEIKSNISEFSKMGSLLKRCKNQLLQLNQENVSLKYKILALKEALSLSAASSLSEEVKSLNFELNLLHKENATLNKRILELSQENSLQKQSSILSNEIKYLKCQMEMFMEENKALRQRNLLLEKENNILKRSYLSPDEVPSFKTQIRQINEENLDSDTTLEGQRKEMSREKYTALTDDMQTLKHQINQLIQEKQELKAKLKDKETKENLLQKLMKENKSLKDKVVDKVESTTSPSEMGNHIIQLQKALQREEEKCKYLENELAETSNKHFSEVTLLKNQLAELHKELGEHKEKCKFLENQLADTSNKNPSEEVTLLKNQLAELQEQLVIQEDKCKYLENELIETSNKSSSEETVLLKNYIVQLQKEIEEQDEKCKYLENELADTSNKLIESEVKTKLNSEATTDINDISNYRLQNMKKELIDEQSARELAEQILQYTQYELDKERNLTKELQGQISMLEEIAVEKHLKQFSESINTRPLPKNSTEASEVSAEQLTSEMESSKREMSKLEGDKVNLEEAIKCNKALVRENLYLKLRLQNSKYLKEHSNENKMKELENLKAENLELLRQLKSSENKISLYEVELHKLYSETVRLNEEVKRRKSAEKIMEKGLETKQKLEDTINENSEATVEYKDLQADFEELKIQTTEIRDELPQEKQEWYKTTLKSEDTQMIAHEYEMDTSQKTQVKMKGIRQSELKSQGEERSQLSALIQSFHVAIHELGTKLSETADSLQVNELKDLECATGKLETEVKALREQMLSGDTTAMSLLSTCISEKQQLKDFFQNLMDELNIVKEYGCGIDIIKANLQQKTEEKIQLETVVKKMESEIETLRQLNCENEGKALSTLQEVKYVVDSMRRKCQTCSEAYDHCTNLLKGFSLEGLSVTDSKEVDWRNKCTVLENELQEVKHKLSNCEKQLQQVTSEKESQKLKALSLEKELKHLQHEYDVSGDVPVATEALKHTTRLKDTLSKHKDLHNLKQTSSSESKDTEKIQEVMRLIERMRRKCRRCAAAYDHCTDLLTQVIAKSAPSSSDAALVTLQQKYEELLNEFETKKSVEEELIAERSRVLCLQKEIENMQKNLEEYKIQEHVTIDNILNEERKRTEALERELSEWKKKYEESWDLINTQTLRNTKAKASSPRIKAMKAEITELKMQLKTLQKEEVSSEMLNAEREKNINLQKDLEKLRKEFEQYKTQEQCYIEDMLNAEVQKTVALEQEVSEWKCKYEDCWKLMNAKISSTTEPMSTTVHVRAMESEIADLKEKLSIYKMERSSLDPEISFNKMTDTETKNIKVLEEELEKLRGTNKKLNEAIEEMEIKHEREVKELTDKIEELEMKLTSISGQQTSDYEEGNTTVRLEFQKQLMQKESIYEANIKSLKASFERDIKSLKKLHDENILRLQKQHDEELQEVNRMHEAELKVISTPAGDHHHHHHMNLTLSIPQSQQRETDITSEHAGDSNAEDVLKDSLLTYGSPSRSFTNILTKILKDGINALDFSELSHLHQEVCQATSAFVLDANDVSPEEMLKSSQESLDKGHLSKCISALQMEVIKRQKEAEQKVLYLGMQVCKERKRICEMREQLRHEKEENLDLRNCIGAQSQSIATLKMEKSLMQRQSECVKQRLQQYIVLLKKERAKARLLEEEVSKVKSTKKKLENLLEMEKKYNETNETRQALFIEAMKMKLDTAIESEAKLRYQLNQKQSCQMAGDAGITQRGDELEDDAHEL